jgi:hypothetical protein
MPVHESIEHRTVVDLSLGSRVTLLLAVLFLIAAGYTYWVPLSVPSSTGAAFGCGSAANAPTGAFQKGVCGDISTVSLYQAVALLLAALVLGGGGLLLFGASRRTQTRRLSRSVAEPGTPD